jgi:hypothetical protein
MGLGLGFGMAAMDNVLSCLGFFPVLFLWLWDGFSYSALSLGVCYGARMCMDLSVSVVMTFLFDWISLLFMGFVFIMICSVL